MAANRQSAAAWAAEQVAAVCDDPSGRRSLANSLYDGPYGTAPAHLPYRRAHLAFIDWQLRRGVLRAPTAANPGSTWWRAVNERLLRDGLEMIGRADGRDGQPSSRSVVLWTRFLDQPSAVRWYEAHNASIVGGYLDHADLAERENETERFFLNVILLRALYAHAMCANPRLALGWLGRLSPLLGDPRVRMTGAFLRLGRTVPDIYPAQADVGENLELENPFARLLDFGVIGPRLRSLYDWSADAVGEPRLRGLLDARDSPSYAISIPAHNWHPARPSLAVRIVRRAVPVK